MNMPFELRHQQEAEDAEITPETPKDTAPEKHPRGGRGTKASPELSELIKKTLEENKVKDRQLADEIKRDEALLDKEVEKLTNIHAQFEEDLAALKKRLNEETDKKEHKRLNALMSQAEDHIHVLSSIFPKEAGATKDHDVEVFRSVAEKFKQYEEARRKQTIADVKLNEGTGSAGDAIRAQAEAVGIREEISSLLKKGEEMLERDKPSPSIDDSISIHTGEEDENRANEYMESHPSPEPSSHTIETIDNKNLNEINMSQETPPLATTSTPSEQLPETPEDKKAAGARKFKETLEEQLAELEGKTDPASNTERAEIERSLSDINSVFTATADNWQDQAIKNFEKSGGVVLDDTLPVLTEVVESPAHTTEETLEAPVASQESTSETSPSEKVSPPALTPEQIEAFAAKNKEVRERILGNIAQVESEVESRAEKAGMNRGLLRNVGEAWNKFPTRYKLLLTAGMAVSGLGAAALGATATAGTIAAIGAGIRGASGAGMFVAFEKLLKNRAEKGGVERTGAAEVRDTAIAAALSIFIVGVLPGILRDYAVESGVTEKVTGFFGGDTTHAEIPLSPEPLSGNILDSGVYIEAVGPGDSVWTMAERQLAEHYGDKFTGLSPEKQAYIIDAIKDKVVEYPESYGIGGPDAGALEVGEHVDFGGLLANESFMNETFSGAQGLSGEEISNIANYQGEAVETPARTVSPSEFVKEPLLTSFAAPEGTDTSSFMPELIKPEETMPSEFTPSDPQVLEYANQQVHGHINDLFGSKGFLGFGAEDGMNSINWKDPDVGFANKTVEQVMNATPSNFPEDGARHFGVEDYSATEKMKSYLTLAGKETGVMPHQGENVQAYINRAAAFNIDRFMKNG